MKQALAAVALVLASSVLWADGGDISKINGSIRVDSGQQVGSVDTVNGSIHLGDSVTAGDIESVSGSIEIGHDGSVGTVNTVNGSVTLGHDTKAKSIELVNGRLRLDEQAHVSGDVTSVNGAIELSKAAQVEGRLENVNGKIELNAASVGKGIQTNTGDIEIGSGSRVDGGILVKKDRNSVFTSKRKPRITIGPDAIVNGTLKFEREVELHISNSAKVGEIVGATPIRD
jgi:DUF4097 and DUF4098 domain-containing protein YvlB